MSDAPIGVFDSGVGGLTVLRALRAELPRERFIYLGDTARLPYGTKSPETVARYALQATEALCGFGVKFLVIACNTASALGMAAIRHWAEDLPVVGVIEPGARAACAASKTGHIAVIATESTIRGGAYQRALRECRPDAQIRAASAQLLVALAEEGLTHGPIAEAVARHYLDALFESGRGAVPDTLVLGCTHFPVFVQTFRAVLGDAVRIVDSAVTAARTVRQQLDAQGLLAQHAAAAEPVRFLATDGPERFARVGSHFLGHDVDAGQVEVVDL